MTIQHTQKIEIPPQEDFSSGLYSPSPSPGNPN
uniref:Uncharacterized protein n=1 Tax=Anguilla anguilla TaxID=7936 RepID=A0A0E9PT77_ANGAN